MQHHRYEDMLTFPDRLEKEAERLRQEAEATPPGPERESLLKRARQAETALHINEWLTSPGLKPPA
ncbi:hypothetical protein [Bradyrhizobium valentinum]|uniref:hypothetical protein n=1 Tax=Bradyrhizobium valentinum TaxID=1518501 RepID=UPI0007093296|nr:hypothetical protein [Bradyrhizobium valentinum]KRR01427.1 hypothetical protein CQ10_20785 [Bradyrhizobium valentinum]